MPKRSNQIRIIAGSFRGRKIRFPDLPGLRPTPDRVKETLFNWLAPHIHGAYCLDLFAGSGSLGIEAISRGANHVTFIENNTKAINPLQNTIAELTIHNATILTETFPQLTFTPSCPFDIVFLDPPFRQGLAALCCDWLERHHKAWLKDNAYIYIETEHSLTSLPVPSNWKLLRNKVAGDVAYRLLRRDL